MELIYIINKRESYMNLKLNNKKEKMLLKYSLQEFYHENIKLGKNNEYKTIIKSLINRLG